MFDKEIRTYFRNGNIAEKTHYANGQLHGEYARFNDNGTLKIHTSYQESELSETYKAYNEEGSCRIIEYDAGKPIHDYSSQFIFATTTCKLQSGLARREKHQADGLSEEEHDLSR